MAHRRPDCGHEKARVGGLVFPGVGFLVCLVSTRLRVQMIIGCVDQLSAFDRVERSINNIVQISNLS